MHIDIFVTGGTFDKEYNELNGELFFKDTHINEILNLGRNLVKTNIRVLMMVDSQSMSLEDRQIIAHNCQKTNNDKIIIIHGTDTMVETAKEIASKVKNKTVVLTGAMIPYKLGSSDGLFNMGSAIAFVQTLPEGVYIAMNGKYFVWDNVRKVKDKGIFETLQ